VFDDLNRYEATTHFNGQSTIDLDGDRATGESYCLAHHLEGFTRMLEQFWGEFDEALVEPQEFIEAGDSVIAVITFRGSGKLSGVEVNMEVFQLWTFRDGTVVRGQGFSDREEALEAAGLRE
jgi:ketosteroid isomerase-like protein